MSSECLKPDEMKKLYYYLMTSDEQIDFEIGIVVSEGSRNPSFMMEGIEYLERERAVIGSYAQESTYGRTRAEIITHARDHFTSCHPCMEQYKAAVNRRAIYVAQVIKGVKVKGALPATTSSLEALTRKADFLGVLGADANPLPSK